MERLILAFSEEKSLAHAKSFLASNGYVPDSCFCRGADVIRRVRQLGSAIVICGFRLQDITANNLALSLYGSAMLLVMTPPAYLELCHGENLCKLATPVSRSDFMSALTLLHQIDTRIVRRMVVPRKTEEELLVSRAKKQLMQQNCMSEQEAHRFLQKRSMNHRQKMAETARQILIASS